MNGDDRVERGIDALAAQFGIPREEVLATMRERFGERFADEAILALGGAWGRDGLSPRDRSLVVVAALVAQGGVEERLRPHVRFALANGATREELEEVVTLLAVYAGYPRTSVALETIRDELDRLEREP